MDQFDLLSMSKLFLGPATIDLCLLSVGCVPSGGGGASTFRNASAGKLLGKHRLGGCHHLSQGLFLTSRMFSCLSPTGAFRFSTFLLKMCSLYGINDLFGGSFSPRIEYRKVFTNCF